MKKEEFSYDKAMQELEEIVARMEDSENSLDNMVADVKRASALIVQCRKKLQDVETDINKAFSEISE
ncbi:MAG: exodeoxyribonuclease VII small subunit [Bacteroidales bacterium]|jgi:exodeoxyribonuclease VII small subunit|nr:exodeoxyribonuclease VII small subunit [Bacteroidales bacterium]MCR4799055.1 exodeoxyribonuclease VII small subunit [Bacteroidales bacterium]